MEPKKPGNPNMEDFKELDDRIIAEGMSQPSLVIKTNLDPDNVTEENPYYKNTSSQKEKFEDYFEEK
ncbi:hypothetical protein GCM10008967_08780 [Bacillus carboniphilus]|uniref:Uncharacterized protein n=1 Tax=Bacillus carboniphilus TaxID=86663 RepID=A0ABN0VYF0_9BACI